MKIVLIDSEPARVPVLRLLLAEAGHAVAEVASVTAAAAVLARELPDLGSVCKVVALGHATP